MAIVPDGRLSGAAGSLMLGVVIVIALFVTALSGCGSDNASDQLAEQEKQSVDRPGEGEKSGSSTAPGSSTSDSPGSFAPAAPASPTGPRSSPATPPGYWKRCGDAPGATRVEHHNEDCSTAKRIAGKYSRTTRTPRTGAA